MATVSRLSHSKRNLIFGVLSSLLGIFTSFAVRTVLLYTLNEAFLGLNGLFTSIMQILNITDLGFSVAIMFILYKPIADGDDDRINAIANFLRKIYLVIGLIIIALGAAIMPALKFLVNNNTSPEHLEMLGDLNFYIPFAIYVLNSSISYIFFGYKSTILSAMQRQDIVSIIHILSTTLARIAQIVCLLLFRNYYVFVALLVLGSVLNNVFIQILSKKYFPNIKPKGKIDDESKKTFKKQIGSVFLGRLGDIARNSFDSIFISIFLGIVFVGIYENYFYIYSAIYGIMGVIIHAIQASVGNSIATESKEKNYDDLLKFNFIFMVFVGFCTVCMACLYQPFMMIWMKGRTDMLMKDYDMFIFCIYFYFINMTYVRSMYLDGYGLFSQRKWLFILEVVFNVGLNALLGYFWGLTGILLASTITILVFNYIGQNYVLFKHYFKMSSKTFYLQNLLYLGVTVAICALVYLGCYFIPTIPGSGIWPYVWDFLIKLGICLIAPIILYLLVYFKYKYFKTSLVYVRAMLSHRKTESQSEEENVEKGEAKEVKE